ncbi:MULTISPECIES: hypothetical protein [unclassified Clostridium]|uniref:hypothetical protein n=1 Tax=unclassified Clostridium TaxID=2614128 RepID=UPI00207AC2D6|nr:MULTISPECIES: hypothetical protein [unclassified Clostridium]
MFDLDIRLFNYIYINCKSLGQAFGFGAFEGFILYTGTILMVITTTLSKKAKS